LNGIHKANIRLAVLKSSSDIYWNSCLA